MLKFRIHSTSISGCTKSTWVPWHLLFLRVFWVLGPEFGIMSDLAEDVVDRFCMHVDVQASEPS